MSCVYSSKTRTGQPWNWIACEREDGKLIKIKEIILDPEKPELFLAWLDGVVALKVSLPPDPLTIRIELGQESVAFRRSSAALANLWGRLGRDAAVALKRQLWAQLLKLVYGREVESDALWFQHTFLVIAAKCIALAVLGLREDDPKHLLSGDAFRAAGIGGAVESDFFDWVVADIEGEDLVRRIMNHVRHRPLLEHVLDPACGSGTFLFHAIRVLLHEAEESDMTPEYRAAEVCARVDGMDIHPVAVIIARVTYLLALAPALKHRKGALSIPVYLGDAMQLSISEIVGGKELTIRVPPPPAGEGASGTRDANGREQLDFPDTFCRDPALFDKAIERMRGGAETGMTRARADRGGAFPHYRVALPRRRDERAEAGDKGPRAPARRARFGVGLCGAQSFAALGLFFRRRLGEHRHRQSALGRLPPYERRLAKPFQGAGEGRKGLCRRQARYAERSLRAFCRARGVALSTFWKLAFVLPLAALSRGQFERLRSGSFMSARIAWDEVWTMDDRVQPLFPVPSCGVFGRRRATSKPFPGKVRAYSGTLPFRDAPEEIADQRLKVRKGAPAVDITIFEGGSPYRTAFRNGATLYPRQLCFVERKAMGRLGPDPSAPYVASRRSTQEKEPWKKLPGIENKVEAEFLHPVLLGESILPYRVLRPFEAVVPATNKGEVLDAEAAANRGYEGLHGWMKKAERVWNADRPSPISFAQQLDYYGKLASQFPLAPLRVVYSKAGMQPAACLLRGATYVIDHKLYWSAPATAMEARYLTALLNSETARARGESLQSRGQWGARDFDKVMFNLSIPRFTPENPLHNAIAEAARAAETIAACVELPDNVKFQRARGLVRAALTEAGVAQRIDALVAQLLDGG